MKPYFKRKALLVSIFSQSPPKNPFGELFHNDFPHKQSQGHLPTISTLAHASHAAESFATNSAGQYQGGTSRRLCNK